MRHDGLNTWWVHWHFLSLQSLKKLSFVYFQFNNGSFSGNSYFMIFWWFQHFFDGHWRSLHSILSSNLVFPSQLLSQVQVLKTTIHQSTSWSLGVLSNIGILTLIWMRWTQNEWIWSNGYWTLDQPCFAFVSHYFLFLLSHFKVVLTLESNPALLLSSYKVHQNFTFEKCLPLLALLCRLPKSNPSPRPASQFHSIFT